jgi:membrane protein DedA with SNARE-associated domain
MLEQLSDFIANYGYYALFVGTFLEGETILVLGGLAAAAGDLNLGLVIVVAFCGSLAGDQTVFFIGRFLGTRILGWLTANRPWRQARVDKVHRLLERHHVLLLLGFRFLYGLRNIIPLVVGSSEVKTSRFIFLNVIGAAVWATTVACGGFLFGHALELFIGKARGIVLLSVAAIAVIIWIARHIYLRRVARRAKQAEGTKT